MTATTATEEIANVVSTHVSNIVTGLLDQNVIQAQTAERILVSKLTDRVIKLVQRFIVDPNGAFEAAPEEGAKQPMTTDEVRALKVNADVDVLKEINALQGYFKHHQTAFDTFKQLLEVLELVKADSSIDYKSASISSEQFGFDESLFAYLSEELIGLRNMLNDPANPKHPLSIGSIEAVFMTLCRRIYLASTYNEVMEYVRKPLTDGEVVDANDSRIPTRDIWPFLIIDARLIRIGSIMFLKMYFSDWNDETKTIAGNGIFNFVLPLYIYAAIPLCTGKHDLVHCDTRYTYPITKVRGAGLTRNDFCNNLYNLRSRYAVGRQFVRHANDPYNE